MDTSSGSPGRAERPTDGGPYGFLVLSACPSEPSLVAITSLTLCAISLTDNSQSILGTSELVHQIAGASQLVSLPLAGASLARRLATDERWARTARVVGRMTVVARGLAAACLTTRLPDVFPSLAIPGVLDGRGVSGLVPRALFGLETLMLMALAVHLLRLTAGSTRERRELGRVEATG